MKKRLLAIAMTLAMTLSLLPVTAGAAGTSGLNEELFGTESVDDLETQEDTQQPSSAVTLEHDDTVAGYDSITAAIDATHEYNSKDNRSLYTITLNNDLEEDVVIPPNRYIIIDLNGHTLTNVSGHTITNKSTRITIKDTSSGKTGRVDNTSHGKGAVYNDINATITLSGGTYMRSKEASTGSDSSGENSWYVLKNFGTMTINSGVTVKFSDSNNGLYSSLIGNGWQNSAAAENGSNGEPKPSEGNNKASLTINGGTFTGGQITVKNDDYGVLTIKGGTITQPSENRYAVANNHTATISGGTIKAKEVVISSRYYDGGANAGTLKISGGTFESETSNAVYISSGADLTMTGGTYKTGDTSAYLITIANGGKAEISGGEFPGAQASRVVNTNEAFKDGYGPAWNPDGTISVGVTSTAAEAVVKAIDDTTTNYLTLSAAMSAAPAGSTVVLQRDVTLSKSVSTVNYGVTLDLNGHDIDGTTVSGSNSAVNLKTNYGSKPVEGVSSAMRLINSVPDQGGTITAKSPLNFSAGDSRIPLECEIGAGVILEVTGGGDNAVKLGSSAYLIYSDTAAGYIKNGGFRVTVDGTDRIYGAFANAASAAADGAVVTLMNAYNGSNVIKSGDNSIILDLNGKTYTYTGTDKIVDVNYDGASLTIRDGILTGSASSADGIVSIESGVTISLEKVTVNVPGESYGIATNGTESNNTIILKDSTLNVKDGFGIYFPSSGSVTIENSEINAKYTGVQMCAGNLAVKGDQTEITVTAEPETKEEGDGVISDGAAISIVKRDGYQKLGTVSIEAGTFTSKDSGSAIKAYTFNNTDKTEGAWAEANETIAVTGGTFTSGDGEKSDVSDYIPEGAALKQNEHGTIIEDTSKSTVAQIGTVGYTSLEAALAAAKDGDVVTLLSNVTLDGNGKTNNQGILTITKNITLDGNGKTITAERVTADAVTAAGPSMINIQDGANVTVRNLTIDGTEVVSGGAKPDATKHGLNIYGDTTTVTVENVTIKNGNGYAIVANGADVTVDGLITENNGWGGVNVDSKSGAASLTIKDADISESNSVKIENSSVQGSEQEDPTVTIQDGNFKDIVLGDSIVEDTYKTSDKMVISGGTFTDGNEKGAVNIADYLADGLAIDGNGNVYTPSHGGSSGSSGYAITVPSNIKNGDVTVSPSRATAGTVVTITVKPDAGYELASLAVYDADGDAVSLTDAGNGKYTFTMPRSKVTVEAAFSEIVEEPETLPFADVPTGAYYYDAVAWAVENGVTGGTSATTFSPDNACTRAQMMTFLWRASGSPEPESNVNPFADVSSSAYYYKAVLWAVENGITSGTSATTFSPDATVTRGQTVTFLWRNAGSPAASGSSFADVAADAYYAPAVAWAAREGITGGTSATTFSPDNACTRAQIVTFLWRDLV